MPLREQYKNDRALIMPTSRMRRLIRIKYLVTNHFQAKIVGAPCHSP